MKMNIGYISVTDLDLNPHITDKFKLLKGPYTRKISSRGDKVCSKILRFSVDYEEVKDNTELMKNSSVIITREPFFLDEDLESKVLKWISWANSASLSEYDPFYTE